MYWMYLEIDLCTIHSLYESVSGIRTEVRESVRACVPLVQIYMEETMVKETYPIRVNENEMMPILRGV